MPEGFESAVGASASASAQIERLREILGRPSASAEDFGESWTQHGTDFETHLAAIADDLAHLATHLRGATLSHDPVAAMNEALSSVDEEGEAWDVIGAPLDRQVAVARDLDPGVGPKRQELAGLHWGRIGKDAARLKGLAAAIEHIPGVAGDHVGAVRAAAAGLESALAAIRTEYETYRDHSAETHLNLPKGHESAARKKIEIWYRATDRAKSDVDALLGVALENLRVIAEAEPFADLPPPPGTVEIKGAGRTITVASPDGLGHVKVTVRAASGAKSYDLDFDAASGVTPTRADPEAEHVPAGTNGKCVIRDGDVTITAERSLFDANTITLTVDDGTNEPSTHALELPVQESEPEPEPEPADPGGKLSGVLVPKQPDSSRGGTGWSVHGDLFDSGDPVHSMHGVLVEDDLESQ